MQTETPTIKYAGGRTGILLIHGLAGTPAEVRYTANGLARLGYTVHCVQLGGHSRSEAELNRASWQDWYDSCDCALTELRKDCDIVLVGGLSTGALLGLLLASLRPNDVQGNILYSPTLWLTGWAIPAHARLFGLVRSKWLAKWFSFTDRAPHGIKDERLRAFILTAMNHGDHDKAGMLNTPGGAVFEHRRLVDKVKGLLTSITQPTLIMHPRDDDIAGLDNAWFLQRRLPGRVELTVLEDSYHMITIDRQRQTVVERTAQFAAKLAAEYIGKVAGGMRSSRNTTAVDRHAHAMAS